MRPVLLAVPLIIGALGCQPDAPTDAPIKPERAEGAQDSAPPIAGKLIDLTHTYDDTTVYWPTAEGFQLRQDAAGMTDKGYYYAANTIITAEHGGTHIDAPLHFFENRRTVAEIPLEQLIADAVVVDVQAKCKDNPDYQISVADLRAWEKKHGRQLVDVILLLRTGYARFWPERAKYLGTTAMGEEAVSQLHFPGLDPEAAKWLVEQRAIFAIGIDTASIDFGQSTHFQSHVKLFEHNIPALENVNIPPHLPEEGFTLIALPMKIGGGSGGPTRIVAVVPD